MLVVPVARTRIATGEIDEVNRDVILNRSTNHPRVRPLIVLMRAKDQDGMRQRVSGQLKYVRCQRVARCVVHFHLRPENPALTRRECERGLLSKCRARWVEADP